jgi:hypothetical protein
MRPGLRGIVRAISRRYIAGSARSALALGFAGYRRRMIGPAVARLAEAVRDVSRGASYQGHRIRFFCEGGRIFVRRS